MSPDLNNADLERELRRRADSARLRNDWARLELLPAVRFRMEAGVKRVPSPRLAPVAGIAAMAAVLVLLVVALPRLVPGPQSTGEASPTPNAGPVVLSTQKFATRLTAGELVGSTVLVEGRIGQYEGSVVDTDCSPLADRACFMGQLDGVQPFVYVVTRYVATPEGEGRAHGYGPEAWSWWHLPVPPVEGILVLTVQSDGSLEYMGRVKPAGAGLTWSAREASQLDPESLDLGELVLVDGWLTSIGGLISGVPPQPGTFIGGLPQRYSGSPAWVLDQRVVLDPNGYQEPEGGIRVQNGAYYEFASDPAPVDAASPTLEPRRATYALTRRLEGGGCPNDAPPCWQWNVIGRVTSNSLQDPPATPEPSIGLPSATTPPPTSPPPNARTITCGRIVALPGRLGTASPPEGSPTVTDETGLITSCFISASLLNRDGPPVTVSNSDSSQDQLSVTWLGNPCDIQTMFTFRQSGDSYELTGQRPDVGCDESLVRHRIEISLSQPVSSDLVAVSVPSVTTSEPPATPTPAAAPTLEPVTSHTIDCDGAPTGDVAGAMTMVDHTGLVRGCSLPDPIDRDPALLRTSDPRVLTFHWTIPCAADVSSTVLDFWSREAVTAGSSLPPYLLIASRSERKPGSGCFTTIGGRVVQIVFNEPIAMADVEFVLVEEAGGGDLYEFEGGYIALTLTSERTEYTAGEPIEIQAELFYDGTEPTLTLSGVTTLVNGFGIEQLDGPLAMGPGWDEPCVRHEIRAFEPISFPYVKSAGWSQDDPDADFLEEWVRDPELRLPAGTWLVTAYSEFAIGSECAAAQVELEASIVIHVR
jgi:hypothetical protein